MGCDIRTYIEVEKGEEEWEVNPNPVFHSGNKKKWAYPLLNRSYSLFGFLAGVAHFESALISGRVKAGMVRAKAQGKKISRPTLLASVQQQIKDLHDQQVSINQISKN